MSKCFVDCNVLNPRNPVPEKWHFWHGRVEFEVLVPVLAGFGHGGNAAERLSSAASLISGGMLQNKLIYSRLHKMTSPNLRGVIFRKVLLDRKTRGTLEKTIPNVSSL